MRPSQIGIDQGRDVGDWKALPIVERACLRPGHTATDGEGGAVLAHHVFRIVRQFFHQERHGPNRPLEGPAQFRLQFVRDLAICDGVTGQEDDLVADRRLEEHDLGSQQTDVIRRRQRHSGIETAERVNFALLQIDDTEVRLE